MIGDGLAAEEIFLAMLRATLPAVEAVEGLAFFQESGAAQLGVMIERFGGAILADEPGLGKSFVAAAMARRYQDQGVAVEVIAPASLHEQWMGTLHTFGVTAVIEHSEALHRRPWVRAEESKLIVVDEAHRFRNRKTAGYRALAQRSIRQRLLLITASPFWNRIEDVHALLALFLADDAMRLRGIVSLERVFDEEQRPHLEAVLEEVMVRRGRGVLPEEFRIGSLQNRVIRHLVPGVEAARPLIQRLQFPLIAHSRGDTILLARFLFRRLESSPEAFQDTLSRQRRFYRRAEESLREGRRLTKRDYRILYGDDGEETPFQDLLFRDLWISQAAAVPEASQVSRELELIEQLLSVGRGKEDPKLAGLLQLLNGLDGPALIFSGAIATAQAVHRECARVCRAALITSRVVIDARGRKALPHVIFEAFFRGEVDVIVSTDRSSEGLNLQRASNVIHYDIPWSPLRLDQRNGRAHRIGRVKDVTAWYFIPVLTESAVMKVVARKNRARRGLFARDRNSSARSRWSWIEKSFRSQLQAIEGKSFDVNDGGPAILLIERITGGEMCRELILWRDGLIDDSWMAIASAVAREGPACAPRCLGGDFDQVCRLIETRARTFAILPAALPNSASGRRLHASARQKKLLTSELEIILSRRYPAGIELVMQEMSGEYLDAPRISDLIALLRCREPAEVPEKVRVIAALKVRAT